MMLLFAVTSLWLRGVSGVSKDQLGPLVKEVAFVPDSHSDWQPGTHSDVPILAPHSIQKQIEEPDKRWQQHSPNEVQDRRTDISGVDFGKLGRPGRLPEPYLPELEPSRNVQEKLVDPPQPDSEKRVYPPIPEDLEIVTKDSIIYDPAATGSRPRARAPSSNRGSSFPGTIISDKLRSWTEVANLARQKQVLKAEPLDPKDGITCDKLPPRQKCPTGHTAQLTVRWYLAPDNTCRSYLWGWCIREGLEREKAIRTREMCEEQCIPPI